MVDILELTGREKAAILLIALGKEYSAKIFKNLRDEEIEMLTLDITNVRRVDSDTKEAVIDEFYECCMAQNYISEGGIDYARNLLEQAMGPDKALQVIARLTSSFQVKPFEFLRRVDPSQLINFVQSEHPQTIAMIMSFAEPALAASLLAELPVEKQTEVVARIATMDRVSPDYVREIERVLDRELATMAVDDFSQVGGIQTIVDILNSVDRSTERHVLESLERQDTELVDEIRRKMFVFEDVVKLDKKAVMRVLKDVENNDLIVALKNATDEVKEMIFSNMSKRQQEMVKEDMEYMGPVRVRDVEEAQQKIVNIIRKLQDAGEIVVSRGAGDEVIG
jgi:flagellar motor switch protein FliG